MKINILGTEYELDATTEKADPRLCECDGYCDAYEKRIAIETEYNEQAPGSIGDFDSLRRKTTRHEMVHAYFFESGLTEWAENEQLVNWIAIQFPKMLATFREVDAL